MNKSSDLPMHVYLRRGKYLYVEKLGYRPVRLFAALDLAPTQPEEPRDE